MGPILTLFAALAPHGGEPVALLRDLVPIQTGDTLFASPKAKRYYVLCVGLFDDRRLDAYDSAGKRISATPLKGRLMVLGTDDEGRPVFDSPAKRAKYETPAQVRLKMRSDPTIHTETEDFRFAIRDGVLLQESDDETFLSWPRKALVRLAIAPGGWRNLGDWGVSPDLSRFAALASREAKLATVDLDAKEPKVRWTTLRRTDGVALGQAGIGDLCVLSRRAAVALVAPEEIERAPYRRPPGGLGADVYNETETVERALVRIDLESGEVAVVKRLRLSLFGTQMTTLASNGLVLLSDHQALRILRVDLITSPQLGEPLATR